MKPTSWEDRLILFVGHLIDNDRKSATIKSYISAIKAVLKTDGQSLDENKYLLKSLTRACKLKNDRVRTRLPIQKGMLKILLNKLCDIFGTQPYLCSLYRAIFASAYFGLLRVGEITSGSHPILAKDVHIGSNKQKIMFVLHTSKTHGLDQKPQVIKIHSTDTIYTKQKNKVKDVQICPFTIMRSYLSHREKGYININEPFFIFKDRTPVKPNNMRSILKSVLGQSGFNEDFYNTHSFRIGRSVDLKILNISVETIRFLGRWRSSSVYDYLK